MKKILLGLLLAVVLLSAVLAFRAATLTSLQPEAGPAAEVSIDVDAAAARFSEALTYPTISHQEEADRPAEAFLAFHDFLERSFPGVHETLTRETVSELSLLYTWAGREPGLEPILLMGHIDVVPVIPGTEDDWRHPPYGGVIAGGEIWGRGALDNKSSVMAILEAVEHLVATGFRPRRTIYLAFGHDEEVGGAEGAKVIAQTLAARGVASYAFVLDEGGFIRESMGEMTDGPVAFVGIAEKGFVTLELVVEGSGGHSSAPPESTSLGILARAVTRLEENQFPARLDGATEAMMDHLAPETPFLARMILANRWLTRPVVLRLALADPSTAAMVRTTTAVTVMDGGVKENVLPIRARALVNHRILPGDTVESVARRAREVIDDERVRVEPLGWTGEPSPVSDPGSEAFRLVGRTIKEVLPGEGVVVVPYLVIGGTDAKHYSGRSDAVFRFLPISAGDDITEMLHGTNERIPVDGLELAIRYFVRLIENSDALS